MGLMDALKNPDIWQYIGGVGAGINRASAGQPFDITQANAGLAQSIEDRHKKAKVQSLLDQMDLTPVQKQLFGLMPDKGIEAMLDQQFAGAADDYGLNIVWGYDANGNYVPMQARKSGGLSAAALPEGVSPLAPYNAATVDTGTGTLIYDPRRAITPGLGAPGAPGAPGVPGAPGGPTPGVAPVPGAAPVPDATGGYVPRDERTPARDRAAGSAEGAAEVEKAISVEDRAQMAAQNLRILDNLINDPFLPSMVGPIDGRTPDWSGDSARVVSKMEQVLGGAFREAYQGLKGGGPITDREGAAATQAITRLGSEKARMMSYEDYMDALMELRQISENAVRRARGEEVEEYISPSIRFAGLDLSPEEQEQIMGLPPGQRLEINGKPYVFDGQVLVPE